MANFHTHLTAGLVASAAFGVACFTANAASASEAAVLFLVGTLGSLLPDIDLDHSRIGRWVFGALSGMGALLAVWLWEQFSNKDLVFWDRLALWGVAYFGLRAVVCGAFCRLTRHRGMVHSVPFMALFGLLLTLGGFYFFGLGAAFSWLLGLFLFGGALLHLLLDEIYSVDVRGLRIKKSFGTALKFFERKNKWRYVALYALLLGLLAFAPSGAALWAAFA